MTARKPLVLGTAGRQQQIQSGDTVALPAATAGAASLNLPPGTAPTSPANGDMWATSAGLFVRVAGVTVGPLGTGGGGSSSGWAPVVNGASPAVLIDDGAGNLIMTPYA